MSKTTVTKELVFVRFDISLADIFRQGFAVIEKDYWEEEKAKISQYLSENNLETIEVGELFGGGNFDLNCYFEESITLKDAQLLQKFFGKSYKQRILVEYGFFVFINYFIDERRNLVDC